jgi:hypothetical protein
MDSDISKVKISSVNTVQTFFTLIDIKLPDEKALKFLWADWNCGFYRNRCRDFLYKFRNNILGINARVCKFVNTVNAECTLCCINKEPLPVNAESFVHLFFIVLLLIGTVPELKENFFRNSPMPRKLLEKTFGSLVNYRITLVLIHLFPHSLMWLIMQFGK